MSGSGDSGLQAERTTLAWTRTSFALMANGALLTIRDLHGAAGLAGVVPPVLAAVVAGCTYVIALQRQWTLQRRPLPTRITPRRDVHILGFTVLLLILVTAFSQLV